MSFLESTQAFAKHDPRIARECERHAAGMSADWELGEEVLRRLALLLEKGVLTIRPSMEAAVEPAEKRAKLQYTQPNGEVCEVSAQSAALVELTETGLQFTGFLFGQLSTFGGRPVPWMEGKDCSMVLRNLYSALEIPLPPRLY